METGKTLAELDVKAGDVVSWNNKMEYIIGGIRGDGRYYQKYSDPWSNLSNEPEWHIVSRATPQSPAKPRKMHPDDFMLAVSEFAADNGFGVTHIDFYATEYVGCTRPQHSYSV